MKQIFATSLFVAASLAQSFAQNVNCTFRSKMTFPGQTLANICGYARDGREYALIGASLGMVIADITEPDSPRQIVQIPGPNNLWKEIKTYRQYAYIVSEGGQGVQIVSLKSLPEAPTKYQYYKGDGPIAGQLGRIHALHIDTTKGFLYAFGSSILGGVPLVFDLKPDPYNPRYVGKFDALGYVHDGYVDNDTMYSCHIYAGQFAIVNMADKADPELLNTQTTPNQFTHNAWLSTDRRTIFTTDETANSFLAAYDVSDPEDIKLLDKIQSNPGSQSVVHNTHIIGNFAVTSWYKDGFTIVDVSRPDNLVQVGNYDTYTGGGSGFDGCWGVYPYFPSGTVIASNIRGAGSNAGELYIITPKYERACFLEGKITNGTTGNPLSGAKIELLGVGLTENSAANGLYKMGQLERGHFTARVSKSGFQTFETAVFLDNGALTVLDVVLFPPGKLQITGYVRRGTDQTPIGGARVELFGKDTEHQATTGANGFFKFSDIPPGMYEVVASADGEGSAMLFDQRLAADASLDLMLFLAGRRDAAEVCPGNTCFDITQIADFHAFPNPFHDEVTLKLPADLDGQPLVVLDAADQKRQILTAQNGLARFGQGWPTGMYFVQIGQGKTLKVLKVD